MSRSDRSAAGGSEPFRLSVGQKVAIFGLALTVYVLARLLQNAVLPADCRANGALVFLLTGMPTMFGCAVLFSARSRGVNRPVLLREGALSTVVVIANLLAWTSWECLLDHAWYATLSYMPVLFVVTSFLIARWSRFVPKDVTSGDATATDMDSPPPTA